MAAARRFGAAHHGAETRDQVSLSGSETGSF
jgi:hypothetical protein